MALDAEDQARLKKIENGLVGTDPAFVAAFRRWAPTTGPRPAGPGWSVAPEWVLMVFLVAFATWAVTPVLGGLLAVVCAGRALTRAAQPRRRPPGR